MIPHQAPTDEWLEMRAERLEMYGQEWLDWELLIEIMMRQHIAWYHPSRLVNNWYIEGCNYNMSEVNWTILMCTCMENMNLPKELDKYKLLML